MKIVIECENPFRLGWLVQHLGGKIEDFEREFKDEYEKLIFMDGFKMGKESGPNKHWAYLEELKLKYFYIKKGE